MIVTSAEPFQPTCPQLRQGKLRNRVLNSLSALRITTQLHLACAMFPAAVTALQALQSVSGVRGSDCSNLKVATAFPRAVGGTTNRRNRHYLDLMILRMLL